MLTKVVLVMDKLYIHKCKFTTFVLFVVFYFSSFYFVYIFFILWYFSLNVCILLFLMDNTTCEIVRLQFYT